MASGMSWSEGRLSHREVTMEEIRSRQDVNNQVADQEDEGKIVIYYDENQAEIEIVDAAHNNQANQADNQEGNVENKNYNQGMMEAREVIEVDDDQENKVETGYEPLAAMFLLVNEPELPENRHRYVGIHDWPLVWTYEEQMIWELGGLGSSFSNPNVEIN